MHVLIGTTTLQIIILW